MSSAPSPRQNKLIKFSPITKFSIKTATIVPTLVRNMFLIGRVFLIIFVVASQLSSTRLGILARSISKRSLPQYMEYDSPVSQPPEHRSHIVKIHPRKGYRSDEPVLNDVTAFRGIGQDHNAFGGPSYAGQHYPFADRTQQNRKDQQQAVHGNFSFGNLLSGLALWNLANEFNTYNNQESHQLTSNINSRQDHQQNQRSSEK